jgi:DNA-3-methyladenine glycosylase
VPPLSHTFFLRPTLTVARRLLGKTLHSRSGALRIVETEAYRADDDPACHAFRRKSRANAALFGPPGTAYVHINYGIHHCLNVVCQPEGVAEGVLIRALDGPGATRERFAGPGRLGKSLAIRKETHDGIDLLDTSGPLWLGEGEDLPDDAVTTTTRIGITKAADFPWRFYITDSALVSRR